MSVLNIPVPVLIAAVNLGAHLSLGAGFMLNSRTSPIKAAALGGYLGFATKVLGELISRQGQKPLTKREFVILAGESLIAAGAGALIGVSLRADPPISQSKKNLPKISCSPRDR